MPRGAYSPPQPRVPALGLPESHSVGAGQKMLPVLPAVREGGVPGTAFSRARRLPAPAPGSKPTPRRCPSLPIHRLSLPGRASGPYITEPRSLRQPGQAGGPAPTPVQPTLGLRVGFQAPTPACEQGAGASRGGVSLESQSPPRETATPCVWGGHKRRCGPWGDLSGVWVGGWPTSGGHLALGRWSSWQENKDSCLPGPHLPSNLLMEVTVS